MARYLGGYSNKMRGRRSLSSAQQPVAAGQTPVERWRDPILQVRPTDPLICPKCQDSMRVIAVIDQRAVTGKSSAAWTSGKAPRR